MKLLFVFIILGFSCQLFALEKELSGNIEGQLRNSTNNDEAKEDLFQDWDNENFYLIYGNLSGKIEMEKSRIEANWFVRYSQSDLYEPKKPNPFGQKTPYFATQIFTFPNKLVARDLFKMQHIDQSGNHKSESILNKLYYEHSFENNRFMIGRMYVNYGLGEIFNPINPFNQPTALTSISQVAQGNDGVSFTYFASDSHSIQFLLLGDKSLNNYEGEITHTLWAHGEYQASDKLQIDYVIGEDQNRDKLGGQISYRFEEAMMFAEVLYQTENIKDEPSNNLWDALLGYDQQLTSKWHIRFESGYQKANRFLTPTNIGERFLPTEYFAALANVIEVHPLVKVSATFVNDIKSGFVYFITKGTYDIGHNMETELFVFTPLAKGDATDNVFQKLVTTDVGVALRAFF
jgi:hypothetical protein